MREIAAERLRPERICELVDSTQFGVVEQPLSTWETLANNALLRKLAILVVLAAIWELYARWLNNPLLIPTFSATVAAFFTAITKGDLLA